MVPISVPGTTYYVDAANGNNENDGLSRATAVRTLVRGAALLDPAGGDKLVLRGTFAETLRLVRINTGSSPNPALPTVVQCDFDSFGAPLEARIDGGIAGAASFPFDKRGLPAGFGPGTGNYLDKGIDVAECNYVTISGIEVRGIAGQGLLSWRSSHVRYEHLSFEWLAETSLYLTKGTQQHPTTVDLTVAHCRINQSNLGAWQDEGTLQGFSMRSETVSIEYFDGFTVYGCHVSNSGMEGIDFKVGASNGTIHHNIVENTRSAGIYANEGVDTEIHHNIVRNVGYYDPEDGSGLQAAGPYFSSKVPFSLAAVGAAGISIGNGDLNGPPLETGRVYGIRVYENVIAWTHKPGITINNLWRLAGTPGWLVDDIRIYNNVVYRSCEGEQSGAAAITLDIGMTNSSVVNNIITRSERSGIEIIDAQAGTFLASNEIEHNLFFENAVTGVTGNNAVAGDPLFVQEPAAAGDPDDFQLRPGSPAIDAGRNVGLPETGGTPTDIGAYQFGVAPWLAGVGSVP